MATRAAEALRLDRVLFVPTFATPLKEVSSLAPPHARLAMLRLALKGEPRFEACDLEVRRGGVSYTVDTLRSLKEETRARLFLIVGSDAFRLLPQWRELGVVRRLATVVVAVRPGHSAGPGMPMRYILDAPLLEISGSDIRERVRRGLSIRSLVPEAVERYIRRKGLYR